MKVLVSTATATAATTTTSTPPPRRNGMLGDPHQVSPLHFPISNPLTKEQKPSTQHHRYEPLLACWIVDANGRRNVAATRVSNRGGVNDAENAQGRPRTPPGRPNRVTETPNLPLADKFMDLKCKKHCTCVMPMTLHAKYLVWPYVMRHNLLGEQLSLW
jgi:hypothetical protein